MSTIEEQVYKQIWIQASKQVWDRRACINGQIDQQIYVLIKRQVWDQIVHKINNPTCILIINQVVSQLTKKVVV